MRFADVRTAMLAFLDRSAPSPLWAAGTMGDLLAYR